MFKVGFTVKQPLFKKQLQLLFTIKNIFNINFLFYSRQGSTAGKAGSAELRTDVFARSHGSHRYINCFFYGYFFYAYALYI